MEPDIENMTLNEYLEYEAEKERSFNYPHYHEDIEVKKYYELPPLHPCFQYAQPYTQVGLVSSNESNEVDTDSMIIAEYELYIDTTIEDVEMLRLILTSPHDTYDTPATDLILDELLKELKGELLNITVVDNKQYYNPLKDIEDPERLLAKDPQSYFTEI
ncbi:hypothetical protein Tco_0396120 [Tanacetum coccineum]